MKLPLCYGPATITLHPELAYRLKLFIVEAYLDTFIEPGYGMPNRKERADVLKLLVDVLTEQVPNPER